MSNIGVRNFEMWGESFTPQSACHAAGLEANALGSPAASGGSGLMQGGHQC